MTKKYVYRQLNDDLDQYIYDFRKKVEEDFDLPYPLTGYVIAQAIIAEVFSIRMGNWTEEQRKMYVALHSNALQGNENLYEWFIKNTLSKEDQKEYQLDYESLLSGDLSPVQWEDEKSK